MNLFDNSRSYVVKLDNLDMNYLINTSFHSNTISPLWTVNNLNSRRYDYCEFEVTAEVRDNSKTGDESDHYYDDTNDTNSKKYKCVICNTNVPIVFRNNHINSPKHKISVKIAQIVLERVKGHLTDVEEISQKPVNSNFCEPCAFAVKDSDMKAHNSSNEHRKALLHDKLLQDMVKIYENAEYIDSANWEYLLRDNRSDDDILSLSSEQSEESSLEGETNKSYNSEIQLDDDFKGIQLEKNHAENNNNEINTPMHKWSRIEGNFIQIKTADQCILEVTFDNYHGFYSHQNGRTQCRVCRIMVDGTIDQHVLTTKHMQRMNIPLEDMHCFRKVDSLFSHCVLCNDNFTSIESHKSMQSHKIALNEAMSRNKVIHNKFEQPKHVEELLSVENVVPPQPLRNSASQTYCKPCKRYIDTHNFKSHSSGYMHRFNERIEDEITRSQAENCADEATNAKPNKDSVNTEFAKNAVEESKAIKDVKYNHNSNPGADNSITLSKSGISSQNHSEHTKPVEEPVTQTNVVPQQSSLSNSGQTYCGPCKRYIHTHNFKSHSAGYTHRWNEQIELMNKLKGSQVEEKTSNINNLSINDPRSRGNGHNSTLNADGLTTLPQTTDIKSQAPVTSAETETTDELNIMYHVKPDGLFYTCKACNVRLLSMSISFIANHVQGQNHRCNYDAMLKVNKIIKKDNQLFCDHCKGYIEKEKEYEDIETEEHKVSDTETYECTFCKKLVLVLKRKTHNESPIHKLNVSIHNFEVRWKS